MGNVKHGAHTPQNLQHMDTGDISLLLQSPAHASPVHPAHLAAAGQDGLCEEGADAAASGLRLAPARQAPPRIQALDVPCLQNMHPTPAQGPCKELPSEGRCQPSAALSGSDNPTARPSACALRLMSDPWGPTGCGGAPVGVGAGQHVHPGLAALAAGALVLEGRHVDEQAGVPMVRAAYDGHMLRARPRLRLRRHSWAAVL